MGVKRKTPDHHLVMVEEAIGKKFENLTVLNMVGVDKNRKIIVKCLCDCGNEYETLLIYLRNNNKVKKHCGCKGRNINKETICKSSELGVQKLIEMGIAQTDPKITSAKEVYRNNYKDGNLSFEDFFILSQQNCFYCGIGPSNCSNAYLTKSGESRLHIKQYRIDNGNFIYNGLDRIDSSFPHTLENVVPCCYPCNWSKSNRKQNDFFDWINNLYNNLKKKGLI
jgi:hypothetical protein